MNMRMPDVSTQNAIIRGLMGTALGLSVAGSASLQLAIISYFGIDFTLANIGDNKEWFVNGYAKWILFNGWLAIGVFVFVGLLLLLQGGMYLVQWPKVSKRKVTTLGGLMGVALSVSVGASAGLQISIISSCLGIDYTLANIGYNKDVFVEGYAKGIVDNGWLSIGVLVFIGLLYLLQWGLYLVRRRVVKGEMGDTKMGR